MNTHSLKKYAWLLLMGLLPLGFVACSDDDEPAKEVIIPDEPDEPENEVYQDSKVYANAFAYNVMNDVYLWKQDITDALDAWNFSSDPIETVAKVRYKNSAGEDVDKWTMMTESYTEMVGGVNGESVSGTYGCSYSFYLKASGSEDVVAFVRYTYPDSPAEKAGLVRGDVVLEIGGKPMTLSNYTDLYYTSSITLGVGTYEGSGNYSSVKKTVTMNVVSMYEDPVLMSKVFDCGGKKVGYLAYTSFTFESSLALVEACKYFKQEGVTELILDLRYNGGGYVFTENVLASMLAPEQEVKNGSVFETEVWNEEYMAYYKQKGTDLNTYFSQEFTGNYNNKVYNIGTSDANIGLSKIYALVTGSSASASEAILVGLMPYMDIEIIGTQTHGKYCTGIMWQGKEWFQSLSDSYKSAGKNFADVYPQFADWEKYIADWGIYVMISRYADKNGNNPCMPDGLTPDIEQDDYVEESYPLGDEREAMLYVALQRAGKTDLQSRVESRSVLAPSLGKPVDFSASPLDGKRIATGERIIPKMQGVR